VAGGVHDDDDRCTLGSLPAILSLLLLLLLDFALTRAPKHSLTLSLCLSL
jgi:hypothetical protein